MKVDIFDGADWASPHHNGSIDVSPEVSAGRLPVFRIREIDGEIQIESRDGPLIVRPIDGSKIRIINREG